MKRALLGTTALIGASLGATAPAAAESPIQLSVGGFFRTAYLVVLDDDNSLPNNVAQEPGDDKAEDGVFSDAEIHFVGRTVLDNGLRSARASNSKARTTSRRTATATRSTKPGSISPAASAKCAWARPMTRCGRLHPAPGGLPLGHRPIMAQFAERASDRRREQQCLRVDDRGMAEVIYFSTAVPAVSAIHAQSRYGGMATGAARISACRQDLRPGGRADADASVYLTYSYQGRNWGLTWGGGASWEMGTDDSAFLDFKDQDFYQTGLTVDIGRFSIGGVFEYSTTQQQRISFDSAKTSMPGSRAAAYAYRAWTFGAQYPYRQDTFRISAAATQDEQVQRRAVATVNYALGPDQSGRRSRYTRSDRTALFESDEIMTGWKSASAPPCRSEGRVPET
jgi:hypothetical protein